MKIAIQEIMKNNLRYTILGTIILLIAFLTLAISGLARGLSYDNAALILDMPTGTFYMDEAAEGKHNFSAISDSQIEALQHTHWTCQEKLDRRLRELCKSILTVSRDGTDTQRMIHK